MPQELRATPDEIYQRLRARQAALERRLAATLQEGGLSARALAALPHLLAGLDARRVARAREEAERTMAVEIIPWEELTRPSLATLQAKNPRGLRRA